jgi:peptidoglycan/xylan/chitin deacetylase (PgdA/CDA1 family)
LARTYIGALQCANLMLRLFGRPFVMLVSLASVAAGSWLGLGRPSVQETERLASTARAAAPQWVHALSPHAPPDRGAPLPPEHVAPAVDPSQLPDPTPFPHLNPEETTRRAWLLAEGPAPAPGDGRRVVTFTFDDGPFPETTPTILEILARHHIRATFFWIGRYLDGEDDRAVTTRAVARQVAAAGHYIGNHTRDHAQLTTLSRRQVLDEIDSCSRSIERVVGVHPTLFRPPYGAIDPWTSDALRKRGMDLVLWSVEAADMTHGDPIAMTDSLRAQIEYAGGGIVLLHDIRLTTIPVLSGLLDWLDAHRYDPHHPERVGYEVLDLAEYLQETGRSPQPFPDRNALEHARAVEARTEQQRARDKTIKRVVARGEDEGIIEPL